MEVIFQFNMQFEIISFVSERYEIMSWKCSFQLRYKDF